MIPVSFKQQTGVIPGGTNHMDIPFYKEGMRIVTCWQLNKDEIDDIVKTGKVWLHVIGNTLPHLSMSGNNPFKVLAPLTSDGSIDAFLTLVENDELILVRIKEEECNFHVVSDDNIWYELTFKRRGDVDKKWFKSHYSFKEPVEVVGLGNDCPEYFWVLAGFGIKREECLILKRVNKTPDDYENTTQDKA